jgi:hypothetical protein
MAAIIKALPKVTETRFDVEVVKVVRHILRCRAGRFADRGNLWRRSELGLFF